MLKNLKRTLSVPGFGGGGTPSPPPPPPPPPEPPKMVDEAVVKARTDERKRAALAAGSAGTIKTSPQGLTDTANTAGKTLLGQ
jgi:hypothetical protein